MNAQFRLRRSYLRLGLLCTGFFGVMAVASALGIYFAAPPQRQAAAVVVALAVAGFWLAWMGLAVWLLLAFWRERLWVRDEEIECVGVIRRKRIWVAEIVSARWRAWPVGGSLVLKTASTRLALDFDKYEAEQRRHLIRFFREAVPLPLQTGWELFCARIIKRQNAERRRAEKTEPGEGEVRLTRRRLDGCFLLGVLLAIPIAIYGFQVTGNIRYLGTPLVLLPMWLAVRFMHPRKGTISKRLSADPGGPLLLLALGAFFAGFACYVLLKALAPAAASGFLLFFSVVWFAAAFGVAWVFDRRRKREEQECVEEIRRRGELLPAELLGP